MIYIVILFLFEIQVFDVAYIFDVYFIILLNVHLNYFIGFKLNLFQVI